MEVISFTATEAPNSRQYYVKVTDGAGSNYYSPGKYNFTSNSGKPNDYTETAWSGQTAEVEGNVHYHIRHIYSYRTREFTISAPVTITVGYNETTQQVNKERWTAHSDNVTLLNNVQARDNDCGHGYYEVNFPSGTKNYTFTWTGAVNQGHYSIVEWFMVNNAYRYNDEDGICVYSQNDDDAGASVVFKNIDLGGYHCLSANFHGGEVTDSSLKITYQGVSYRWDPI